MSEQTGEVPSAKDPAEAGGSPPAEMPGDVENVSPTADSHHGRGYISKTDRLTHWRKGEPPQKWDPIPYEVPQEEVGSSKTEGREIRGGEPRSLDETLRNLVRERDERFATAVVGTIEEAVDGLEFDKYGNEEHLTPGQVEDLWGALFKGAGQHLRPEDMMAALRDTFDIRMPGWDTPIQQNPAQEYRGSEKILKNPAPPYEPKLPKDNPEPPYEGPTPKVDLEPTPPTASDADKRIGK